VPSAMRASIAMTSAARDCGCELGSRCAAATLLASLAVRWARTASVLPHGVAPIAGTVGATFAAALVGKALGILRARSRLRRLLRACSNEASAAPAIASGV
jgi:ABC-type proline/glycine betaine transport system permease subunit